MPLSKTIFPNSANFSAGCTERTWSYSQPIGVCKCNDELAAPLVKERRRRRMAGCAQHVCRCFMQQVSSLHRRLSIILDVWSRRRAGAGIKLSCQPRQQTYTVRRCCFKVSLMYIASKILCTAVLWPFGPSHILTSPCIVQRWIQCKTKRRIKKINKNSERDAS